MRKSLATGPVFSLTGTDEIVKMYLIRHKPCPLATLQIIFWCYSGWLLAIKL